MSFTRKYFYKIHNTWWFHMIILHNFCNFHHYKTIVWIVCEILHKNCLLYGNRYVWNNMFAWLSHIYCYCWTMKNDFTMLFFHTFTSQLTMSSSYSHITHVIFQYHMVISSILHTTLKTIIANNTDIRKYNISFSAMPTFVPPRPRHLHLR